MLHNHELTRINDIRGGATKQSPDTPQQPPVDEDEEDEPPQLVEAWWPTWWGQKTGKRTNETARIISSSSSNNKKTVKVNSTKFDNTKGSRKRKDGKVEDKNDKPVKDTKAPKRSRLFLKKKVNKIGKNDDADKTGDSKNSTVVTEDSPSNLDSEVSQNTTETTSSETSTTSSNATKSDTERESTNKASPPSSTSSPMTSSLILMGGPPGPGMSIGPRPTPQQQQQQQQQQLRRATASLAAAEALGVLLGNSIRIFFIMAVTRYFGNRQETIAPTQHFVFERLNDFFVRDSMALETSLDEAPMGIRPSRWRHIMAGRSKSKPSLFYRPNLDATFSRTVIVIEFGNNAQGNLDLKFLANLVSFLLVKHEEQAFGSVKQVVEDESNGMKGTTVVTRPVELEVVFKIDSPGGSVATFGLAAAQVERLRRVEGISTTVCVDKYAASGGYMIASQADRLVAAPFATVGSVGVIMETLNFHDMLRQYGVQPLVLKAGDAKNPLTTFGAVTKLDMEMEQERLEKVHHEFQKFTIRGRPQLQARVKEICNGSVYIGDEALALNLIDDIMTSDEYLMGRMRAGDRVLKVHKSHQSRLSQQMRFPSPIDLLPHLKGRIEGWMSHPNTPGLLMQVTSFVGFALHMIGSRMGKPPGSSPTS